MAWPFSQTEKARAQSIAIPSLVNSHNYPTMNGKTGFASVRQKPIRRGDVVLAVGQEAKSADSR